MASRLASGAQLHYMPNGGNLGDALINAAAMQAFTRRGMSWRMLLGGREFMAEGDIAVHGGGGSLIERYEGARATLRFMHTLGVPVVVLPQTVRGADDFWNELPPTTVFCRDRRSYDFMVRFAQHEVFLGHDLAVNLAVDLDPYTIAARYRAGLVAAGVTRGELRAFRGDDESGDRSRIGDLDLSALGYPTMTDQSTVVGAAMSLLMMVAPFDTVTTDRLHVAIAGGLLGVPVTFFDNDYGKLSDVWALSMRDRFPTVLPAVTPE